MTDEQQIQEFLDDAAMLVEKLSSTAIAEVVAHLDDLRLRRGHLYVVGNGGSAATASHFVSDLAAIDHTPAFSCSALSDNVSIVTAVANDFDYESVFSHQLRPRLTKDDTLLVISCSGNSRNVLRALDVAEQVGATSVGLLGSAGAASAKCDYVIAVDSTTAFAVEGIHSVVTHAIATALRARGAFQPRQRGEGG